MNTRPERRAQLAEKTTTDLINYALDLEDQLDAIDEGLGRAITQLHDQADAAEQALATAPAGREAPTATPSEPISPIARLAARLKNRNSR